MADVLDTLDADVPATPLEAGQIAPGNIDLSNRPQVRNPDGSISTVRSISIGVDGKEVLIPTVSDDGRVLSNNDAIDLYKRTGKHLGIFADPDSATAYAKNLHESQAAMIAPRVDTVPPGRRGDRFSSMQASDAEIGQAVQQLNAGQPVTELPRQDWSFAQSQAFNAKLDAYDQQAKAAAIARDQAQRDAQMLDQMMRVAKSTKDVEVAMQQQDVIGFRNAVATGTPPIQALQRFPRAATAPMVSAINASTMAPAPKLLDVGGVKGVQSGTRGERFQYLPASATATAAETPKPIDVGNGVQVLQTGPHSWQVLNKGQVAGDVSKVDAERLRAINHKETGLFADMRLIPAGKRVPGNAAYMDVRHKLALLDQERTAIFRGASGTPAPAAAPAAAPAPAPAFDFVRDPTTGKLKKATKP